jgi:hypothetical protein
MPETEFQTFPTGGSGLAPVVMAKGQSLVDPQLLMSTVQQIMNRKQRAREFDIELQRLGQQEALARDQHQIERERLAQEYPLRQAQIRNYDAEASLRSEQMKFIAETKIKDAKAKQTAMMSSKDYLKEIDAIPPDDWGKGDTANKLSLIHMKYDATGLFDLKAGRDLRAQTLTKQRMKENQLAANNVRITKQLRDTLAAKGLSPDAIDYLHQDEKGNFIANEMWAVDKSDGHPYMTVLGKTTPGSKETEWMPISPSDPTAAGLSVEDKITKGYRFRTFTKDEANRALQMKKQRDDYLSGINAAPIDATERAVRGTAAPPAAQDFLRNNPDSRQYYDQTYGEGAAEKILGY